MPNPAEVAELIVNGQSFFDWETVWVHRRHGEAWPQFRFTSAEGSPMPQFWTALQFKPGDRCTIILGGQLAMTGIITIRQTSYDAVNHVVQLSGVGVQWAAATSSIDSKDGNFDNMSVLAAANKATEPFGVSVLPQGTVDETPFDKLQSQPGETVFDFIDRIARMRGVIIGADVNGNILLIGDPPTSAMLQQLVEGENILKMQCIISMEMISTEYSVTGQAPNANDMSARAAAEMEARVPGTMKTVRKFLQTPAEQPVKQMAELMTRAYYEARFRESTVITAFVTVQGWLRDGSSLWAPGDDVWVTAPMAMLDLAMKIQGVTFQQDNEGGTTTVIECVLPWLYTGDPYSTNSTQQQTTDPNALQPQPPGPPTASSDKPRPDVNPADPLANPYAPPGL